MLEDSADIAAQNPCHADHLHRPEPDRHRADAPPPWRLMVVALRTLPPLSVAAQVRIHLPPNNLVLRYSERSRIKDTWFWRRLPAHAIMLQSLWTSGSGWSVIFSWSGFMFEFLPGGTV